VQSLTANLRIALALLTAIAILPSHKALAYPNQDAPPKSSGAGQVGVGLIVLTDPKGVDIKPFTRSLLASVRRKWYEGIPESARRGGSGKVAIDFRVQQDGKLTVDSVKISSSSGKKDLDDAGVNAVRNASPFVPLPDNFPQPFIELRMYFYYNLAPDFR
jgi:TonB family protein